jgi:uncharacterized protein (TIGR02147 family)
MDIDLESSDFSNEVSELLRAALARLKKHNAMISIRSLALNLNVSSSYLSKVFRGVRPLSASLLPGLIRVLQLDHHAVAKIQRSMLLGIEARKFSGGTGLRSMAEPRAGAPAQDYGLLDWSDLWFLENWFTIPLLNLVTTEDFDDSPAWIAARLGISAAQATETLERLQSSGHLERDHLGKLQRSQLKLRLPMQRSHPMVRAFHQRMGEKALRLLQSQPSEADFAQRLISGISFTGDPAKVPEAKLMIEEALYRAAELLANGPAREVFHINLQFFKVTKSS